MAVVADMDDGNKVSIKKLQESLESCSFFLGFWKELLFDDGFYFY